MTLYSPNRGTSRESTPLDTLAAAVKYIRSVSSDRTRRSQVPGASARLHHLLRDSIVEPLWQRADEETDPARRLLRAALADYADQYVRLLANPPSAPEGPRATDPISQRMQIISAILKLQKVLNNDYFDRF